MNDGQARHSDLKPQNEGRGKGRGFQASLGSKVGTCLKEIKIKNQRTQGHVTSSLMAKFLKEKKTPQEYVHVEKAETKKETNDKSGKAGQWEPWQRGQHRLWYYSCSFPITQNNFRTITFQHVNVMFVLVWGDTHVCGYRCALRHLSLYT